MPSSTILSDNGVSSGTSGIKTSGGNDGLLLLQTTTAGGTATTAVTVDTSQNVGIGTSSPISKLDSRGSAYLGADSNVAVYAYSSSTEGRIGVGGRSTVSNVPLTFYVADGGANTERMRLDTSGNLLFNSGYGSVATAYGCRAWVNFNGTGTVAIRASGNVTSITDNGVGDYTVNFTTAMTDANYAAVISGGATANGNAFAYNYGAAPTTSAVRVRGRDVYASSVADCDYVDVSVFR